jgi:hypothetical protein
VQAPVRVPRRVPVPAAGAELPCCSPPAARRRVQRSTLSVSFFGFLEILIKNMVFAAQTLQSAKQTRNFTAFLISL